MKARACVLTIAGSDSGGGAGIQADARTITALGGHALTVITAVTAQDTRGISAWSPVAPGLVRAQLASALGGFPVAAAKTGLLPGAGAIRCVASELARHPSIPLVVDPVIGSTSGTRFLSAVGLRALREELMPRATVTTPNWPEAAALTGLSVGSDAQAERAALLLALGCGRPVLVKGGHGRGRRLRDCLAFPDGEVVWFASRRIATRNTHGTGCVLSAGIAAWLARGAGLEAAVGRAHAFLRRSLAAGRGRDWGPGHGPAFAGR